MYVVIVNLQKSPHFIDVDPASYFHCGLPKYAFLMSEPLEVIRGREAGGLRHFIIKGEGRDRATNHSVRMKKKYDHW